MECTAVSTQRNFHHSVTKQMTHGTYKQHNSHSLCIKNLQNVMSHCRLSQNLRQPSHLILPVSYNNNNNRICNAPDASVTDPEARKVAFTQVE